MSDRQDAPCSEYRFIQICLHTQDLYPPPPMYSSMFRSVMHNTNPTVLVPTAISVSILTPDCNQHQGQGQDKYSNEAANPSDSAVLSEIEQIEQIERMVDLSMLTTVEHSTLVRCRSHVTNTGTDTNTTNSTTNTNDNSTSDTNNRRRNKGSVSVGNTMTSTNRVNAVNTIDTVQWNNSVIVTTPINIITSGKIRVLFTLYHNNHDNRGMGSDITGEATGTDTDTDTGTGSDVYRSIICTQIYDMDIHTGVGTSGIDTTTSTGSASVMPHAMPFEVHFEKKNKNKNKRSGLDMANSDCNSDIDIDSGGGGGTHHASTLHATLVYL